MGKNNHGHHGRRKPSKPDLSKEAEAEAKAKVTASAGPEGQGAAQAEAEATPQDTTAPATKGTDKEARWKEASEFAAQVQAEEEAQAAALSPETETAATAALNPSARAWTPPSVSTSVPVAAQDDAGRAEALRMSEARKAAKEAELSGKADKEADKAVTEEQVRAFLGGAVQPRREAWEDKAESEELLEAAAAGAGAMPEEVDITTSSGTGAENTPSSGRGSSGGGDAPGWGVGLGGGDAAQPVACRG